MYSREESTQIKRKFWTSLGLYMKPVKNASGEGVNWLNYNTGIRHIYFRIDATTKYTSIAIEIRHPDKEDQLLFFEKIKLLIRIFRSVITEEWDWSSNHADDDGVSICRISRTLEGVNIFNEADWPSMISFLKPRLLKLDKFWEHVRHSLL